MHVQGASILQGAKSYPTQAKRRLEWGTGASFEFPVSHFEFKFHNAATCG
jgi:hypothetical protein